MIQEHNAKQPIGVFDSGIGGLTVANAIMEHLPNEQILYFGDTAHLPYGDKSADAIRYYCLKIVKFLLERNCKMIVIACNSASSAGYKVLLEFFKGQALFVNVVDPLVEVTASRKFNKVGVIATKATIASGIYQQQLLHRQAHLSVSALATPLLVPMIEEGYFNNQISQTILHSYLGNPIFEGIESLLLACTHYPLVKKEIEAYFSSQVEVFDSTFVVAKEVKRQLVEHNLCSEEQNDSHQFFVSDYTKSFEETTRLFYRGKEEIKLEYCPIW